MLEGLLMIDFSDWIEYEGASEGSGRSIKIWLKSPTNNQIGLFKFKKDISTTDHISECIANQLSLQVGMECAKFDLGVYKGNEGSMSYNILQDVDDILLEGVGFITSKYPSFNPNTLRDDTGAVYSIEMIQSIFGKSVPFIDLLKVFIFDYLIGNTDRHQSNWAVLRHKGEMRISPIYDNSSSLCAYMNEDKIVKCLGNDLMLWNSILINKSTSIIRIRMSDVKRPQHIEVLRFIRDNFYKETRDFASTISVELQSNKIAIILDMYDSYLSPNRKELIQKYLECKVSTLQELYFGG